MRVRKLIWIMYGLSSIWVLSGCQTGKNTEQCASDFFKELKHYEAVATISFLKDKQPNTIKMKQIAQEDGKYEMILIEPDHLKGTSYKYDGQKLMAYYDVLDQTVEQKVSIAQNEVLLTSFAKRYVSSEHIKKQEVQLNGNKMITYEVPIEGNFKYLSKEKIWLEEKNLTPVQLVLYDDEGNITMEVIYDEVKYNF